MRPNRTAILDHSGNCTRFWDEWNDFFATGCLEQDDGKPKSKPKKRDDEKRTFIKCPACKYVHQPFPRCVVCGFEYPPRITVAHAPGTLKELIAAGEHKKLSADVWPQICTYARASRVDQVLARKLALAKFKSITGAWPLTDFESTEGTLW